MLTGVGTAPHPGTMSSGGGGCDGAVVGINIAAGVAYVAVVDGDGNPALERSTAKIVPASNVDAWTALTQFGTRIVAEVRGAGSTCVGFADPKRYNQWAYSEAFQRASLHVAAGISLAGMGVNAVSVAHKTFASTLNIKSLKTLDVELAERLSIDPASVTHWKNRAPALAVALHLAARTR